MSFQTTVKKLRTSGHIYKLPINGDILKSNNIIDGKKGFIFKNYNIYMYYYNSKVKKYFIDCSIVKKKGGKYLLFFKSIKNNKVWLMKDNKGTIKLNDNNIIIKTFNKYYKEQCTIEHIPSDIYSMIGKYVPSKIKFVSKKQKKIVEERYKTRILSIIKTKNRTQNRTMVSIIVQNLVSNDRYDIITYAFKNKLNIYHNKRTYTFDADDFLYSIYLKHNLNIKLLKIVLYSSSRPKYTFNRILGSYYTSSGDAFGVRDILAVIDMESMFESSDSDEEYEKFIIEPIYK